MGEQLVCGLFVVDFLAQNGGYWFHFIKLLILCVPIKKIEGFRIILFILTNYRRKGRKKSARECQ